VGALFYAVYLIDVEGGVASTTKGGNEMSKYRFRLDLQQFNDGEASEVPPVAESPSVEADGNPSDTGTAPESDSEVTKQESFAKRLKESTDKALADARKQWEQEVADKYKDYDVLKKATEHLQRTSGISDLMTLKEELEMHDLQERAEKENLSPEVLKRLDELEAKAKEAEELKEQVEQAKQLEQFETTLKTYCEGKEIDGKPLDHKELWQYMAENEVSNPDIAYKAMKADLLEAQLAEAKKSGVQEYLASKTGVKTGGGAPTGTENTPAKTLKEAEQRALAQLRSLKEG